MALHTKIKHIDKLPNGVLRFRRKFPQDVAEALDKSALQVHIKNRYGVAFHREYQAILQEHERIVREVRAKLGGVDVRSPTERWHEALLKAEGLVAGTTGLEDDEAFARHEIAKGLAQRGMNDPLLHKALVDPGAAPPEVTLEDAARLYAKDNGLTKDKNAMVRLNRTLGRLSTTLGPLDQFPLRGLRREHGRKFMEHMLTVKKVNGDPLSLGSMKREGTIIAAIINHGIKECDVDLDVGTNPFSSLPWPKDDARSVDKKLPLPDDVVVAVGERLSRGKTTELPLIWRLLSGTGMRLGEASGLTHDDLVLDGETPHVLVRPNSVRGLKTNSSTRSVPLVGDALVAAKEALNSTHQGQPLFPRYARERGSDAASAALMKTLRLETTDKKHTVHGLRHMVSDKLRDAGAPVVVRQGFLGHALEAIAENTYGSPRARLKECAKWAHEAGL